MLLTTDELGAFSDTGLSDEALQILIDAAEAEIVRYAGELERAVEWDVGGQYGIVLSRPVDTLTSIVEWNPWNTESVTLDPLDYEVDPTGYMIYRRPGGPNSRYRWWGRVVVTYVPADEEAIRKGVLVDLVRLMSSYNPGANSETVGSWTIQHSNSSTWNNSAERAAIMDRLIVHGRMAIV